MACREARQSDVSATQRQYHCCSPLLWGHRHFGVVPYARSCYTLSVKACYLNLDLKTTDRSCNTGGSTMGT
eukprot:m.118575 g.118575  ORF g.118575 m.118575 type:complete len:71 (-) comp15569_c0_seq2:169-381(-)